MRSFLKLLSVLCVLLLLTACTAITPTSQPTQTVKIAMGFIPNVQFTPVYVAIDKGYFAEENLEVELDYGSEVDIVSLVGAGELQFAIASGDQVILARSRGLPVVYVFDWYNRFPVSVVSLADAGIDSPEKLIGKNIGIPALYGASYVGWRALLYASGITEDQVSLQAIGYTQASALTEKQVDAAVCYYMNEPVQLVEEGYPVNQIMIADYIDIPAAGIITNEATIKDDPELIRRLLRAFDRGLEFTLENPDEAFDIAVKTVPEIGESAEKQRAVLEASVQLWRTEDIGQSAPEAWEQSVEFMAAAQLIDSVVDSTGMFSNDFLPAKE